MAHLRERAELGHDRLPQEIVSAGSPAVLLAEKNFTAAVSSMSARMTFATSGMTSFIWQKTWFPCGPLFLMKPLP